MYNVVAIIIADVVLLGALWLLVGDALAKTIAMVCGVLLRLAAASAFTLAIALALMQFPEQMSASDWLLALSLMMAGIAALVVADKWHVPIGVLAGACYLLT